jgi:hypothetical protein
VLDLLAVPVTKVVLVLEELKVSEVALGIKVAQAIKEVED